jgi:hypothetical protein
MTEDEAQGRCDGEATAGRLIGNSVTGTVILIDKRPGIVREELTGGEAA